MWTPPCEYLIAMTPRDSNGNVAAGTYHFTYHCIRHGNAATVAGAPCVDNPIPAD